MKMLHIYTLTFKQMLVIMPTLLHNYLPFLSYQTERFLR